MWRARRRFAACHVGAGVRQRPRRPTVRILRNLFQIFCGARCHICHETRNGGCPVKRTQRRPGFGNRGRGHLPARSPRTSAAGGTGAVPLTLRRSPDECACTGPRAPQSIHDDGTALDGRRPHRVPNRRRRRRICAVASEGRHLIPSPHGQLLHPRQRRLLLARGPPVWTPTRRLGSSKPRAADP
jgi:hypothetical protein